VAECSQLARDRQQWKTLISGISDENGEKGTNCSVLRTRRRGRRRTFGVAIVIPLVFLAFCNVRLVCALYRSRQMRHQHSATATAGMRTPKTAGTMVTVTMIAIVLMYAVLVAPGEILTCITKHLLARYDTVTSKWPPPFGE